MGVRDTSPGDHSERSSGRCHRPVHPGGHEGRQQRRHQYLQEPPRARLMKADALFWRVCFLLWTALRGALCLSIVVFANI